MGDTWGEQAAAEAVAAFTSAVDEVAALPLTLLPAQALIELTVLVETQLRRITGLDHTLIAALVASDAYAEVGVRNTAALLVQALRVSPGDASSRVRAAKELGPRTDVTGGPMEPEFAHVAAAQAEGVISAVHARVVTATVRDLPAAVRAEHGESLERFLVDQARAHAPDFVARTARHATAVLDPDGTLASEQDHHRRRGLSLSANPDGSSDIRGHLTPECAAIVHAVLDPLAKPASATKNCAPGAPGCCDTSDTTSDTAASDTGAGSTATGSTATGSTAGSTAPKTIQDPRSPAQRRHDALQDACQRLLRSDTLPDSGGVPATVVVTLTLEQLETRVGTATTSHGGTVTIAQALRLAADADVIPVVLGDGGGILAHGRTRRHATARQRRALTARDGGCSFPRCDTPPEWCQAHRENGVVLLPVAV
jgi:hypothetical protein